MPPLRSAKMPRIKNYLVIPNKIAILSSLTENKWSNAELMWLLINPKQRGPCLDGVYDILDKFEERCLLIRY